MHQETVEFASVILHSITQAHVFHLRTKSFSQHKALQKYYTSVDTLIDTFIETYQGLNKTTLSNYITYDIQDNTDLIPGYFGGLFSYTQKYYSKTKNTTLKNQLDAILELIHTVNYLLTLK